MSNIESSNNEVVESNKVISNFEGSNKNDLSNLSYSNNSYLQNNKIEKQDSDLALSDNLVIQNIQKFENLDNRQIESDQIDLDKKSQLKITPLNYKNENDGVKYTCLNSKFSFGNTKIHSNDKNKELTETNYNELTGNLSNTDEINYRSISNKIKSITQNVEKAKKDNEQFSPSNKPTIKLNSKDYISPIKKVGYKKTVVNTTKLTKPAFLSNNLSHEAQEENLKFLPDNSSNKKNIIEEHGISSEEKSKSENFAKLIANSEVNTDNPTQKNSNYINIDYSNNLNDHKKTISSDVQNKISLNKNLKSNYENQTVYNDKQYENPSSINQDTYSKKAKNTINSRFEKHNQDYLILEALKQNQLQVPSIDLNFDDRMNLDIKQRQEKSDKIQSYLKEKTPKIPIQNQIVTFNRLITDANRRILSKENQKEMMEKLNVKEKKVNLSDWEEKYQNRFLIHLKNKEKVIQILNENKQQILKEEEERIIKYVKDKHKGKGAFSSSSRLYNDAARRNISLEEKRKKQYEKQLENEKLITSKKSFKTEHSDLKKKKITENSIKIEFNKSNSLSNCNINSNLNSNLNSNKNSILNIDQKEISDNLINFQSIDNSQSSILKKSKYNFIKFDSCENQIEEIENSNQVEDIEEHRESQINLNDINKGETKFSINSIVLTNKENITIEDQILLHSPKMHHTLNSLNGNKKSEIEDLNSNDLLDELPLTQPAQSKASILTNHIQSIKKESNFELNSFSPYSVEKKISKKLNYSKSVPKRMNSLTKNEIQKYAQSYYNQKTSSLEKENKNLQSKNFNKSNSSIGASGKKPTEKITNSKLKNNQQESKNELKKEVIKKQSKSKEKFDKSNFKKVEKLTSNNKELETKQIYINTNSMRSTVNNNIKFKIKDNSFAQIISNKFKKEKKTNKSSKENSILGKSNFQNTSESFFNMNLNTFMSNTEASYNLLTDYKQFKHIESIKKDSNTITNKNIPKSISKELSSNFKNLILTNGKLEKFSPKQSKDINIIKKNQNKTLITKDHDARILIDKLFDK